MAPEEIQRRPLDAVDRDRDVGRAEAGTTGRLAGVLPDRVVAVRSEHHGGRAVTVAELDGGLPDDRHQVVLAERGIEAKHVTRVRLLGRECPDRLALGVIGGEQRLVRSAVQDVRELPREVVPVLHAAVAAEPARRRHDVRRVAGDEHAAFLQPRRVLGRRRPALDVLDLDRDLRVAERLADVADAARRAHVLADPDRPRPVVVDGRVHDEEARLEIDREAEESLEARAEDVDDAQVAIAHQRAHVGPEVDRDAVREAPVAELLDAEPLADRAVGAVRCDEIEAAHAALRPGVARPDDDGHARVVLLDGGGLRRVPDLRSEAFRGAEQDGLEPDLRDEDPLRGAEVLHAFVDEAEVPVELLPAEAVDGHDRAVLDELPRGRLLDLLLQADGAIRLHRALVDERGPRVDRGAAVALEDERRDAVMSEEHRCRQPDEAAADDQDGNVFVGHLRLHLLA